MFRAWLFSPLLITFKDSFMLCQYFKYFLYLVCYTTKIRFLFRLTTNSNVKFLLIFITSLSARLLGTKISNFI